MATDGHKMESEDWSMFLNICDQVNSLEEGYDTKSFEILIMMSQSV